MPQYIGLLCRETEHDKVYKNQLLGRTLSVNRTCLQTERSPECSSSNDLGETVLLCFLEKTAVHNLGWQSPNGISL